MANSGGNRIVTAGDDQQGVKYNGVAFNSTPLFAWTINPPMTWVFIGSLVLLQIGIVALYVNREAQRRRTATHA